LAAPLPHPEHRSRAEILASNVISVTPADDPGIATVYHH
jgi:hypothetical protein